MFRILHIITLIVIIQLMSGCSSKSTNEISDETSLDIYQKISLLNNTLVQAALEKDFFIASTIYLDSVILMPEYQPLIDGKESVQSYYEALYERQNLEKYEKEMIEIIDLDEVAIEHGKFVKVFKNDERREGKYFNVWKKEEKGLYQLKAEAFGYFDHLENPETMAFDMEVYGLKGSEGMQPRGGKRIPLEIQAYSEMMENMVRDRNTQGVVDLYTEDGSYYPFANTLKDGKDNLLKHFIDYHRNPVVIDSIEGWTYDYDVVKNGFIRYSQFYVEWTVPGHSGSASGTGINYWIRQENGDLKRHRQIGMHIWEGE